MLYRENMYMQNAADAHTRMRAESHNAGNLLTAPRMSLPLCSRESHGPDGLPEEDTCTGDGAFSSRVVSGKKATPVPMGGERFGRCTTRAPADGLGAENQPFRTLVKSTATSAHRRRPRRHRANHLPPRVLVAGEDGLVSGQDRLPRRWDAPCSAALQVAKACTRHDDLKVSRCRHDRIRREHPAHLGHALVLGAHRAQ